MKKASFAVHKQAYGTLPEIIPMKDDVVFPHVILTLEVTGAGLVTAINEAVARNKLIGIVALKYDVDLPEPNDFYEVGPLRRLSGC
ncbi:MAG: LON peptidase substrate-binding domain-containing protein [Candidatus Brocadia sp.]|nr:LON peptidase substrate-binding domain-containing protein [Candidatus Brocadia sp.]